MTTQIEKQQDGVLVRFIEESGNRYKIKLDVSYIEKIDKEIISIATDKYNVLKYDESNPPYNYVQSRRNSYP